MMISSRMGKLISGSLLIGLAAACATEADVEKVSSSQAAIIVDEQRFAGTPGLFLLFKQGYSGNRQHVSRYQTETSLAHFQYINAAAGYQIREKPTAEAVEEVFLNSEPRDESAASPVLTWAEKGTVLANTSTFKYQMFDADGLPCVGVTRGVGSASADNSLNAYRNMLVGYFCEVSQALTTTEVEKLIKSVQIKR